MADTMRRSGPTRGAERHENATRWTARGGLARVLRLVISLGPIAVGFLATIPLNRALPLDGSLPQFIVRFVILAAVAAVVVIVVERAARRLLPLVALLNLSLVFPDHAPSRFSMSVRAGSTRRLEALIARPGAPSMNQMAVEVLGLVSALNAHDRRTRGHSERVRAYAVMIGDEMNLTADERDKLEWAALLHDIGKLTVPAAILNKNGKPTDDEWKVLARHPGAGEPFIGVLEPWLGEWIGAAGEHHERWDGEGYPRGLKGSEISRAGRIVAVADAFEVMTSARSYKKPMPIEAARTEVTRCADAQFDLDVVRALLNVSLGRLRRVTGPIAGLLQLPLLGEIAGRAASGVAASSGAVVTSAGVAAVIITSAAVVPSARPGSAGAGELGPAASAAAAVDPSGASTTGTNPSDPWAPSAGEPDHAVGPTTTAAAPAPDSTVVPPPASGPGAPAPLAPTTPTTPPSTTPEPVPVTPGPDPSPPDGTYLLGTGGSGDTPSQAWLPLTRSAPTTAVLANYDTDRDAAAGLLVSNGGSGSDNEDALEGLSGQLWSFAPDVSLSVSGTADVRVWAAPKSFSNANRTLQASLYDCRNDGAGCVRLARSDVPVPRTGAFAAVTIGLGPVNRTIAVGHQVVVRLQCDNCWLAYGTTSYPAALTIG